MSPVFDHADVVRYVRRNYPWVETLDDLDQVPQLLRRAGSAEEFCFSARIDAEMVRGCCARGYIPMGAEVGGVPFLLIKLHRRRAVLALDQLRCGKSARRASRGLELVFDADFERCLSTTNSAHQNSWLHGPLRAVYSELHRDGSSAAAAVRFHAAELTDSADTVAGEIGYVAGRLYTSASGFFLRNGAGSAQLIALALQLREAGFEYWDLGMELPYKMALGAQAVSRPEFLALVQREVRGHAALRPAAPGERIAVEELLSRRGSSTHTPRL